MLRRSPVPVIVVAVIAAGVVSLSIWQMRPERPRLALIVDDFGYVDAAVIDSFFALDIPFTAAILPWEPNSLLSAETAHRTGDEVIVHLPTEGAEGHDPGPNALLEDLDENETRARTIDAIEDIPYVAGASNHMGSVLTADSTRMRWIMEEIARRNLFFIDSRTGAGTVAESVARAVGVRSAGRNIFLDDSREFAEIEKQWDRAVLIAESRGSVIVIGHVYPETLRALRILVARDRHRVRFVPASELVH